MGAPQRAPGLRAGPDSGRTHRPVPAGERLLNRTKRKGPGADVSVRRRALSYTTRSVGDRDAHRARRTGDDLDGRVDVARVQVGQLALGDRPQLLAGDRAGGLVPGVLRPAL